jgi:hypothetical protein
MKQKQLLLSMLALFTSFTAYAYEAKIDGIYYNFSENEATVTYQNYDSNSNVHSSDYSGAIVIPESVTYNSKTYSVTSIGEYAFQFCYNLTSITIPNSVTSIGLGAFYECYSLTSITIPSSVTSIGDEAFGFCYFIRFVNKSILTDDFYWSATLCDEETADGLVIKDNIIVRCRCWATSVTIPNNIISIGDGAFDCCYNLTSITIPNSVTSIGYAAFFGCRGLTTVSIPSSVTSIGNFAFSNSGLTSINIPNSVTSIGTNVFNNCISLVSATIDCPTIEYNDFFHCPALTSVIIGSNVESIGEGAFQWCSSLTSVVSKIQKPFAFGSNAFSNIPYNCLLAVPVGTRNDYIAAGWTTSVFKGGVIEDGVSAGFSSYKLYTLTCKRGGMVLTDDETGLAAGQIHTYATEADKHFAIIKYHGAQYLYSPVNKQYLLYDGHFVSHLGSPITFDDTHADGIYKFMISTQNENGGTLYFNNNGYNSLTGIEICGWDTPDDGNRWLIEPVDDFDPTEALALAAAQTFTVTYNVTFDGKIVAMGTEEVAYGCALPPPPASLSNKFITLTKTGTHPTTVTEDITVTYNATWEGPFEFTKTEESAKWYNMKIRGNWYVSKQDKEPYQPEYSVDEATLATPAYQWAFGGDPYHVKIYNRTTGLNETLTKDGDNAVMRSGDYTWDLLPNNDGFVLRVTGTEYSCINQYGGGNGPLKFWTNSQSLSDDGSTFHVEEVISPAIEFADANVKALCVANWDTNGDGELSEAEAAAVTSIYEVFGGNYDITSFNELQYFTGLTIIDENAFRDCSSLTSITIPNSVTSIGEYAFSGCSVLNSITIPNSVKWIGEGAFFYCGLTSLTIPNSVTSINGKILHANHGLSSIIVESGNPVYDSRDNCNAIIETATNTLIEACGNTFIPNSVTGIGAFAFQWFAFGELIIPDNVTRIGDYAFASSSIDHITFGFGVKSIGEYAFSNISGLTDVYCFAEAVPSTSNNAFDGTDIGSATLHVPAVSFIAYSTTAPWSSFGTIIPIDGFVINDETTSFSIAVEESGKAVVLTHQFTGAWEALYLPFAIDYDAIRADFDLAEIDGVVQNDDNNDGIADITVLSIMGFKEQMTEPNTPYLIRAKNAGEQTIVFDDVTVYSTEVATFECSSFSKRYEFTGSYNTLGASALANRYVVQGGELVKGASSLAPCRWYMTAISKTGGALNLPARIRIMPVEDVITGSPLLTSPEEEGLVYNLAGQKILNSKSSNRTPLAPELQLERKKLPRGIYIQNGRKVIFN